MKGHANNHKRHLSLLTYPCKMVQDGSMSSLTSTEHMKDIIYPYFLILLQIGTTASTYKLFLDNWKQVSSEYWQMQNVVYDRLIRETSSNRISSMMDSIGNEITNLINGEIEHTLSLKDLNVAFG